jgi:central kinetochore subunit Mis15/CHL4
LWRYDQENKGSTEKKKLGMKRKSWGCVGGEETKIGCQGKIWECCKADDGKGIEKLGIRLEDHFPVLSALPEAAEPTRKDKKQRGRNSTITVILLN